MQHITWLAPFIYRGLKGVGLEGEEFLRVNKNQGLHIKTEITETVIFDEANKEMPSITCPDALNTLFQGLVQVVPGLGIPPNKALE